MMLPDYWLTRPSVSFGEKARNAFDELLNTTLNSEARPSIQFTSPWPKWQFLCNLADHHDIAMHGSSDPNIDLFEPRQSNDLNEFGNQKAVYAASDGLWAMFFAIVDRERVMSITNACIRLADETGIPWPILCILRQPLVSSQSALANGHGLSLTTEHFHYSATHGIWLQRSSHRTARKYCSRSAISETHGYACRFPVLEAHPWT
jgi:hypothetical protein